MKIPVILLCLCLASIGGCANKKVMSETSERQITVSMSKSEVVSTPDDFQNLILVDDKICAMANPPATFGDTGPSLKLATPSSGTNSLNAGKVTSTNQSLGDTTYLADQLLYRLCELGISYDLDKPEMLEAFYKTLEIIDEIQGKNFDQAALEELMGTPSDDDDVKK